MYIRYEYLKLAKFEPKNTMLFFQNKRVMQQIRKKYIFLCPIVTWREEINCTIVRQPIRTKNQISLSNVEDGAKQYSCTATNEEKDS